VAVDRLRDLAAAAGQAPWVAGGTLLPMPNASASLTAAGVTRSGGRAALTVGAAAVEVGAVRWVTDPAGISDSIHLELVPGQERRALVHVPREEWTAVHIQVLCWRIVTWWAVGVVLHESFLPLWLAGDPQALPILLDVLALGVGADAWLRRRLH
jgi:hypothetical protein